ncbi:MAG: peptide chain release factor N(5)-glutamine methyltransferase [Candidatus Krumholzibacteriota bacterium]|nr:peptide chain release factor N(5)-glutamine methyltransferase [Candidatus Krumholzibacteriota bacterium]
MKNEPFERPGVEQMAGAPTVLNAVRLSEDYLRKYGVESPRLSAEHLLASVMRCSRLDLYLRFEETLEDDTVKRYREYLKKRASHYPLQYILGEVEFVSLPFLVREEVFIPRPETELLIESIEKSLSLRKEIRFLELGTGSGVISGALAHRNKGWRGVAFDISEKAVKLASDNFLKLGVSDRVSLFAGSMFDSICGRGLFDLLVSNPPYIPSKEIAALQKEVAVHENKTALDGGSDGLLFYPALADGGKALLKPGGMLAVEAGDGQAGGIINIFESRGYENIVAREDYNGFERIITAFNP